MVDGKMVSETLKNMYPSQLPTLKMAKSNLRLLAYIVLYLIFLVLGAAIFSAIEAPDEIEMMRAIRRRRSKFLLDFPCISDSDLEELIVEIISANNRGVSAAKNVTSEPNWSFGQSFFFSSTIVTTIGYGHVHPLSEGGKIFCIIYAIIGIPMTFILLTALVERLLLPATWLLYWLNSKLGHLYQPFNIRVFHLAIVGVIAFVLFMVFPSLIFAKLEPGWDFLDSLYYCFISLTTIGLGDYIPGDAQDQPMRPLYKVCITGYLLLGLTFVMLLLHLYNDIPQLNLGLFLLRSAEAAPGDPERMRLSGTAGVTPKYTQQHNDQTVRQNVKVVSRPVDSPSPEEDTTPVHAQMPPIIPGNQ
ncbi:potassium channel subfamily K member 1 isoform X2 [Procambarus clarkii]|uniref:potassium channel subfamily K member 1 isoform X2 n=1 Tax=Procambarus clarkii TaxID=6728 RepID=UPI001E678034|nr:potassium channel subfamily K member 1-like isoform X2 [Procambarus clarkii]